LIRSHACGVGEPIKPNQTRMLMVLRANVFAKGHSGIRPETLRSLLDALNKNCLPLVPSKGTVGASGDLAPLSHLALGLMGEGQMWDPSTETFKPAGEVLQAHGLTPIELRAKEGLALINGTQFMCAIGVEALVRARRIALQADIIAALTLESLHGSSRPFHPAVHAVRPHPGQLAVAARLRTLLNFGAVPSQIMRSHVNCGKVQDSYTMRCVPQIHGVSHDTIEFVGGVLETECNSATGPIKLNFCVD
jgi:histidine ammonia-lyase